MVSIFKNRKIVADHVPLLAMSTVLSTHLFFCCLLAFVFFLKIKHYVSFSSQWKFISLYSPRLVAYFVKVVQSKIKLHSQIHFSGLGEGPD